MVKKLLIILGFFAVMMGFAVWEIVATTSFYKETLRLIDDVDACFETYEEVDAPRSLEALGALERHWDKGHTLIMMFGNHTIVRNADERITALGAYTRLGERSDAVASLRQARHYIGDMMRDVYPQWTNLL